MRRSAERVVGLEGDVVGDPPHGADQGEQFGPDVRVLGRWDAVGQGRLLRNRFKVPAGVASVAPGPWRRATEET
jgi:hypothetical protein